MTNEIGNYARHAQYWDWGGYDRTEEHAYWYHFAAKYGKRVLIPMCALGDTAAYMAQRGMDVTAFDITPEMITEGKKRFGHLPGLHFYEGDVRDFHFDIPPMDFCFSMDFGHLLDIEQVKYALACIRSHLRVGGCLVIETTLPPTRSYDFSVPETYEPAKQIYPGIKVWKTGATKTEAETGRHYISQTFYAQYDDGRKETFDHTFYLQSYSREAWIEAFTQCGYELVREYEHCDVGSWQNGDGFRIFEAVKK